MPELVATGVGATFGGLSPLRGTDLQVGAGEFVAIIGPNGTGKTTMLNLLSGFVLPKGGHMTFGGICLEGPPWLRARRGLVRSFEHGGLFNRMTVLDNVALGSITGTLRLRRARALVWLQRFGLEEFARQSTETLSLGQGRRVELARLFLRAEAMGGNVLLLLDEPFRGLDMEGQAVLASHIRSARRQIPNVSALLIEHHREMAYELSDRLLWLKDGLLHPLDDPSQAPDAAARPVEVAMVPAGQRPGLEVRGLRAGYGRRDILRDVQFLCPMGGAVRIVGTNGSGKSTLLRVLSGYLTPTSGALRFDNRSLERADVGYAPQGGRLVAHMTVDNLLSVARMGPPDDSEDAFIGRFPKLQGLRHRQAASLSAGQRSLAAVWLAIVRRPRLLLADEPAAGLAPDLAQRLYEFFCHDWLRPDRCLVVVEHGESLPGITDVPLVRRSA